MFHLCLFLCLCLSFNAYGQDSFAPIIKRVMPSVVNISTEILDHQDELEIQDDLIFSSDGHVSLGSGFIADEQGYILTNVHVIEKAKEIRVTTSNGETYHADIQGKDDLLDVALLKIKSDLPLQKALFADSDKVEVGDWVIAIGNPFGLSNSVTTGIVSAVSRHINETPFDNYIQTDAPINPGNSGGPMFNLQGEVIGLNTLIFSKQGNSIGVGFALPSNQLKPIFEALKTKGEVERSSIGIEAKETKYKGKTVLIVTAVKNEDLTKKGHVEVGDMILSYNDHIVSDLQAFKSDISWLPVGQTVHLRVIHNGKEEERDVVLSLYQMPQKQKYSLAFDEPEGVYFPKLQLTLHQGVVVQMGEKSEASLKGIKIGDQVKALNGHAFVSDHDIELYINESYDLQKSLRLDMQDSQGEPYFVELKLAETVKRGQN